MTTTARLTSILETMVSAIVEEDAVARHARARNDWFADRGLDPRDRAALAEIDPQTFFVYRHLVRKTLRSAVVAELRRR